MKKHWTDNIKAENERLREEIACLKQAPMIAAFASRVGNSIMVMLAQKPFEQWPEIAKLAFRHEQERTDVPAYFYKERLPKD